MFKNGIFSRILVIETEYAQNTVPYCIFINIFKEIKKRKKNREIISSTWEKREVERKGEVDREKRREKEREREDKNR